MWAMTIGDRVITPHGRLGTVAELGKAVKTLVGFGRRITVRLDQLDGVLLDYYDDQLKRTAQKA